MKNRLFLLLAIIIYGSFGCKNGELLTTVCPESLKDERDGKEYKTILIGNQCWMAQNLNVGIRIAGKIDQLNNGNVEKYCYDDSENNCDLYGGLYQWKEMMGYSTKKDVKGICPEGWHVPSDGDWITLTNFLGGENAAGAKMKSIGTIEGNTGLWYNPNSGANNDSNFTGLPGGSRTIDGEFYTLGSIGNWWSSSQPVNSKAYYRNLGQYNSNVCRFTSNKTAGFSVRCIKDQEVNDVKK